MSLNQYIFENAHGFTDSPSRAGPGEVDRPSGITGLGLGFVDVDKSPVVTTLALALQGSGGLTSRWCLSHY